MRRVFDGSYSYPNQIEIRVKFFPNLFRSPSICAKIKNMKYILSLSLLVFASCAKTESQPEQPKSLFNTWTTTWTNDLTQTKFRTYDFTGASFGAPFNMTVSFKNGAQCSVVATLVAGPDNFGGGEAIGEITYSSSTYISGTGTGDPGCSDMQGTNPYTKKVATLTVYYNGAMYGEDLK